MALSLLCFVASICVEIRTCVDFQFLLSNRLLEDRIQLNIVGKDFSQNFYPMKRIEFDDLLMRKFLYFLIYQTNIRLFQYQLKFF